MRIVRDQEWKFVGIEYNKYLNSHAFNFQHRRYGDEVITLNEAKLVNVVNGWSFELTLDSLMDIYLDVSKSRQLEMTEPSLFDYCRTAYANG